MLDVARRAGVSTQTVSRVLNDHEAVRDDTRRRVLAAVRELDYRPNNAARALASRRSRTIGVISPDTRLHGPRAAARSIESAAAAADYFVSIATYTHTEPDSLNAALEHTLNRGVDALAAIAPHTAGLTRFREATLSIPLVVIGAPASPDYQSVATDDYSGARAAVEHLLALGHTTVHHVAGPVGWTASRLRHRGWRDALADASRAVPVPVPGDWTPRSGYYAGLHLAADPGVTAVFCANDHMALGLLKGLADGGRRVPHDVSVVGFDDIPETAYLSPSLTTVRQDFADLGHRAVTRLVDALSESHRTELTTLDDRVPARLTVRESTACTPIAHRHLPLPLTRQAC